MADTRDRIHEWSARGIDGPGDLSSDFAGAVEAGGDWVFVLDGQCVGGDPDALDAGGTAYDAPHEALPLLFAMLAQDEDPRARYYTEEAPLRETHRTLEDGDFTGYVELSENVLSGDYYVVYHGGASRSVAFVGQNDRLVTDEEAFDAAADEVGIYTVTPATIDAAPIDTGSADDSTAVGGAGGAGVGAGSTPPGSNDSAASGDNVETPTPADGADEEADRAVTAEEPADDAASATGAGDRDEADPLSTDVETATDDDGAATEIGPSAAGETTAGDSDTDSDGADTPGAETGPDPVSAMQPDVTAADDVEGDRSDASDGVDTAGDVDAADDVDATDGTNATAEPNAASGTAGDPPAAGEPEPRTAGTGTDDGGTAVADERIESVTGRLNRVEDAVDDVVDRVDTVEEAIRQLTEEVRADRPESGGRDAAGPAVDPSRARRESTFLVRYGSKADGTIPEALAGDVDPAVALDNLRIEAHPSFDPESTIDGRPYGEFVRDTLEYRAVEWLLGELPFEIQRTGNADALGDLFEVIQAIDRVAVDEPVAIDEEGERRTFDLVGVDRDETPLVVARTHDEQSPAGGGPVKSLVDDASAVAEFHDALGGALLISRGYFDRSAIEAIGGAIGSGSLLSRSKPAFVATRRKQGYHACLVEAGEGGFHLAVPEL